MLALVGGCFWRSYGRLAATHADLLVAMARKGTDLVTSARLTAETMPELTYPLERAQAFTHEAHAKSGTTTPASLIALEQLIATYRDFVDTLDRTRRDQPPATARQALAEPLARVERAAAAVHEALRAENR